MKKSSILVALLGVVIGLLIALLVYRVGENRRMMRVNGNDWRKVSLILQSIDENYVDSVDRAKVSDAIAAAALSALDPHSSYMPPQVLEDSEADLMGNFPAAPPRRSACSRATACSRSTTPTSRGCISRRTAWCAASRAWPAARSS